VGVSPGIVDYLTVATEMSTVFCRLPSPFHEFFMDVDVICVNYIVAPFRRIRLVSTDLHLGKRTMLAGA
jgi:hypothetical protein